MWRLIFFEYADGRIQRLRQPSSGPGGRRNREGGLFEKHPSGAYRGLAFVMAYRGLAFVMLFNVLLTFFGAILFWTHIL
jgi:hypothetical protein